jgi:hypothetical protein
VAASLAVLAGATLTDARPERRAAEPELAVGIVPQRPLEPGEGHAMRRAGIEWSRVWINWAGVEERRGSYEWWRSDAAIEAASNEGISVLPMLFGSPEWAARLDDNLCSQSGCTPYAPASSETRAAFARFAAAAVRRYGPDGLYWSQHPRIPYRPIGVWQVWNEQNMDAFFRPDADPESYGELLDAAAEQIRGQDPEAKVLLGGMFGPTSRDNLIATTRFLTELYRDPDIADSFDGVAVHPYSGNAVGALEQIRRVRRTIEREGDGEPLWVTEVGWASGGRKSEALVKDRRRQARLLRRMFSRFATRHDDWNLAAAFWYAWRDTERGMAVCAWCARSGLISRAGSPKPAYRTMRRVLAAR